MRIELRNRQELLRPGMAASAALPIGAGSDADSGRARGRGAAGRRQLVRVRPEATPACSRSRKIGRGRDLGGEVEVLSGLTAGETIVVDGAFLLKSQAESAGAGHGDH